MTRGKFNTTCDIFRGPGSGAPGVHVGTFPCRLVREDAITTVGSGAPAIPFYLTIDAYTPTGSWKVVGFGLDPSLADQIAIPAGSHVRFWVLYTDHIEWHSPDYFRAYLVQLPLPPAFGTGGVMLGGAATYDFVVNITSAGGLVANSSAYRTVARKYRGSGGVTVNSRGLFHVLSKIQGTGGLVVNSSGVFAHVFKLSGAGGVLTDGAGLWLARHDFAGFGGVLVDSSGQAAYFNGSGVPANPVTPFDLAAVSGLGSLIRADVPVDMGIVTGDKVRVADCLLMTAANGIWTVTTTTFFNFTLDGSVANVSSENGSTSPIVITKLV